MTNYEVIKSFDIERMARFINDMGWVSCEFCCYSESEACNTHTCGEGIMNWLNEEVVKMNNWEHWLAVHETEAEALRAYRLAPCCEICTQYYSECGVGGNECEQHQKEWLRAEYVEPDSFEKLLADLDRLIEEDDNGQKKPLACAYSGTIYCSTCRINGADDCFSNMYKDLKKRIEGLYEMYRN